MFRMHVIHYLLQFFKEIKRQMYNTATTETFERQQMYQKRKCNDYIMHKVNREIVFEHGIYLISTS